MSLVLPSPARRQAIRSRFVTLSVRLRLARVDRLIAAGRGHEARRVMLAVRRDLQRDLVRLDRL